MLPQPKIVVSYADTEMGHHGYVYQATNFIYTGSTKERTDMAGEEGRHSRHNKGVRENRVDRSAKHRYVFFVGNKKEKKRMMQNLKIPVIPYNDIKEYVQLIQKVHVKDGVIEKIEVLQGVDNGWKPQKVELKENI